jgi:hypothetical protein
MPTAKLIFIVDGGGHLFRVPALRQLLATLGAVKWVIVFVLAYCVMKHRRGHLLLAMVVLLNSALVSWVFSANFKSIFFVCLWWR